MSPFIAVAGSVFPEILKLVLSRKHHDKVEALSGAIEGAVKKATNSDDPSDATTAIDQDPKVEAELRIRLAEIAAAEEQEEREALERKREAEQLAQQEKRDFELKQIEASHARTMDRFKAEMEAAGAKRKQDLTELQERLTDVRDARRGFEELAASGSRFAWAPPVISTIIVLGFFSILGILLLQDIPALDLDTEQGERLFQIINIVIGALTAAFATVISFWLGSSQGSKQKDLNSLTVDTRRVAAEERREERLLEQVAKVATSSQPISIETPLAGILPAPVEKTRKLANETNFSRCIGPILEAEGGFVDHPKDPGGATNMGITFNTLQSWRRPADIDVNDVRNLTEEEAKQIYRANYWNALSCDELPNGVDLVVFDFGVNAGPGRSAKTLQRVVGVKDDGVIGPITLAAVQAVDPEHIIRRFGELRMEFYRGLDTFPVFGKGWTRRVEKVGDRALELFRAG
ncbi:glycosyl hydrolase 108 family protein [uncultured Roseobacter sp.]|uniref:glycosyl hydrolase 108 family protein n=1 Tax=uncultured Roseobacter sp. TaxID=114847 RepID=UPI00262DA7BA|nr:glycosyl hydrolase 108 family protein [uncultured Roseobacter sp.]